MYFRSYRKERLASVFFLLESKNIAKCKKNERERDNFNFLRYSLFALIKHFRLAGVKCIHRITL